MAYTDKLRVVYGDYTLGVHGEGYDYIFSYAQGGLESIVKNGYEWLYRSFNITAFSYVFLICIKRNIFVA